MLASCDRLEVEGFRVDRVPARPDGIVDLDALGRALDDRTVVVSLMLVNNEVGTVQPLDDAVALVRDRAPHAVVHTDAVQAVPWVDVPRLAAGADLVAISAHKFGGPKGVGALICSARSRGSLAPMIRGGGQERGGRAGTENVAGIAGFGAAAAAAAAGLAAEAAQMTALRDRLECGLRAISPDAIVFGHDGVRLPNTTLFAVPEMKAETAVIAFDLAGVADGMEIEGHEQRLTSHCRRARSL